MSVALNGHMASRAHSEARDIGADHPGGISKRGWIQIAKRVKQEIKRDRISMVAAGVAFYAFLALFPALAAVISIWGLVADPMEVERQISAFGSALPASARQLIVTAATRIAGSPTSGLGISMAVSLVLALWSANKGMKGLVEGISIAYGDDDSRGMVRTNALSLALTLGATVLVLAAMGMVVLLPIVLSAIGLSDITATLLQLIRWPLLAGAVLLALAIIFRVSPVGKKPAWRWITPGSIIATLLWLLASIGFAAYADNFGSYDRTYGSVAAVAVLLVWFFISAYIVLLGAEINAEGERQTGREQADDESELEDAGWGRPTAGTARPTYH
jgi:membrane protein